MRRMDLDPSSCYRAVATHDARFDGRFFVGVSSTRIYCRPVCRVRTPMPSHCRFFASAAAAEVAGYRPCLRCRPELAPGFASVDAVSRLAQAAAGLIDDGVLADGGIERLAARLGVTSRHVRRIFERAFGVTPIEYAQTQRLLLAKRLLTDTAMPVTDVALASGFASVRRFNALWKARYRMPPSRLRAAAPPQVQPLLHFELAYRPPYDWPAIAAFLDARAIAGVEAVDAAGYARTLAIDHAGTRYAGWVRVRPHGRRHALAVDVAPSLARVLPAVLARIRHAFDLACHPEEVAIALGALAQRAPGLRVPGTMDGFELAVRAIVGQQVSVRGARTLLGRMAARHGEDQQHSGAPVVRLFPSAAAIAAVKSPELAALGILPARARTIVALAQALARGALDLTAGADVEATRRQLLAIPGIGPWTVEYIAMRALAWPDAFPAGDRVILAALRETRPARAEARSQAWRPWRAYAAMHLWRAHA
jgi:AraC family transcriptional regulator of adaptative response / DNA-3-methyladenine glycosylase II